MYGGFSVAYAGLVKEYSAAMEYQRALKRIFDYSSLHLVKFRLAWRKVWATVACGKVKLIIIADSVPVPHRSKPRTHDRKPGIGPFNEGRIILEMCALLAGRPGISQLN